MEVAKLFNKEYEIKERQDGTLVLKPIIRPSDKRNALKEYTTQELVDEVWRRTDEELKREKEEAELSLGYRRFATWNNTYERWMPNKKARQEYEERKAAERAKKQAEDAYEEIAKAVRYV